MSSPQMMRMLGFLLCACAPCIAIATIPSASATVARIRPEHRSALIPVMISPLGLFQVVRCTIGLQRFVQCAPKSSLAMLFDGPSGRLQTFAGSRGSKPRDENVALGTRQVFALRER